MANAKPFSPAKAAACRTLIREGVTKKYLAKALGMTPQTLDRKLDKDELEQYRARDAKRGKVVELDASRPDSLFAAP